MNSNVTTMYPHMKSKIIKIGNSKGVRIPKALLEEAKLQTDIQIVVTKAGLLITPADTIEIDEGVLLSYSALAKEWNTPEEDAAWAYLQ